jgi:PAS domain S-box-containing protein
MSFLMRSEPAEERRQTGYLTAGIQPAAATVRRRARGLRAHLVALVLTALVPAISVGTIAAWQAVQSYRQAFSARLEDTARALALALDGELEVHVTAAVALASAPQLRSGQTEEFRAWAAELAAGIGSWVAVNEASPGFPRLVDTRNEPGTRPAASFGEPFEGAAEVIAQAIATGRPVISDLITAGDGTRPQLAVAAPVLRSDGSVASVVLLGLEPGRLSRLLRAQGLSGGAVAAIADGRRRVIGRSRDEARFLGTPAPEWYAATAGRESGVFEGQTAERQASLFGFHRLRVAPGWGVVVGEPLQVYSASWRRPLLGLGIGAMLALALGLAAAGVLMRRMRRPLHAILDRAEVIAAGAGLPAAPTPPPPGRESIAEFEALRAAVQRADAALRAGEVEFRTAFELAPVAMSQSDPVTGRLLRVNQAYARLVGRPAAALVGLTFRELTHPDDRPAEEAAWQRMARGGVGYEAEKRYLRPDGTVRWCRVSATAVRGPDGAVARTLAAVQDVTERRQAEQALRASQERLRLAMEAARLATWEFDLVRGRGTHDGPPDERYQGPPAVGFTFQDWLDVMHPEDRGPVVGIFADTIAGRRPHFAAEFRMRRRPPAEGWCWIASHGVVVERDPDSGRALHVAGVSQDITERRQAEERRTLLMREVDHRAKNALAVVQAVLRLTRRDDPAAFVAAVEGRVAALARAHTLLAEEGWTGAGLREVVARELGHCPAETVRLEGPPVSLAVSAVQPIAMLLHELATNAAKHGALSRPEGRVDIVWRLDPPGPNAALRLRWTESGGPPLKGAPRQRGFGSQLIEATVRGQLGGRVMFEWNETGLACELTVPAARALAEAGRGEG